MEVEMDGRGRDGRELHVDRREEEIFKRRNNGPASPVHEFSEDSSHPETRTEVAGEHLTPGEATALPGVRGPPLIKPRGRVWTDSPSFRAAWGGPWTREPELGTL